MEPVKAELGDIILDLMRESTIVNMLYQVRLNRLHKRSRLLPEIDSLLVEKLIPADRSPNIVLDYSDLWGFRLTVLANLSHSLILQGEVVREKLKPLKCFIRRLIFHVKIRSKFFLECFLIQITSQIKRYK